MSTRQSRSSARLNVQQSPGSAKEPPTSPTKASKSTPRREPAVQEPEEVEERIVKTEEGEDGPRRSSRPHRRSEKVLEAIAAEAGTLPMKPRRILADSPPPASVKRAAAEGQTVKQVPAVLRKSRQNLAAGSAGNDSPMRATETSSTASRSPQTSSAKSPPGRKQPPAGSESPPAKRRRGLEVREKGEGAQQAEQVPEIEREQEIVTVDDGEIVEYVDEHGQTHQLGPGERVLVEAEDEEAFGNYDRVVVVPRGAGSGAPPAPNRPYYQESMPTMLESLFYSKLNIYKDTFSYSTADVAVNICTPDITEGFMFFDEIHALAGPRLIRDCRNYVGMQFGSCRVTRSYNANKYKCIIHTALPTLPQTTRIVDVEIAQMAIKRCLNEAIARGAQTVAFPAFFPCFSPLVSAEFVLKVISNWMYLTDQKGQLSKLREIKILCHSPSVHRVFKGMINKLYNDLMDIAARVGVENTTLFDVYGVVFAKHKTNAVRYENYPRANPPMTPGDVEDFYANQYDEVYLTDNRRRRRRNQRDYDGEVPPPEQQIQLELSAKLQPSVLVLDDKNGLKRQYRLTNKSKDGRKLYFRCSYCDTLIRKTNIRVRAKITLLDGQIVGEQFPKHHPECRPKTAEDLMVQQLDRKSRREVKDGIMQPREAYEKARQLALQYHHELRAHSASLNDTTLELDESAPAVSGAGPNNPKLEPDPDSSQRSAGPSMPNAYISDSPSFPEWQRIRQQYFRMRKVGEIQKHTQMQVRTDALRQATFMQNDDDETMLVEVDDADAAAAAAMHAHAGGGHLPMEHHVGDMVDVEMATEHRRTPRILVHHRARAAPPPAAQRQQEAEEGRSRSPSPGPDPEDRHAHEQQHEQQEEEEVVEEEEEEQEQQHERPHRRQPQPSRTRAM